MSKYLAQRLLFIVPTILLILTINFTIVQFAPGGPVENAIALIKGHQLAGSNLSNSSENNVQNQRNIDPIIIEKLNKLYGFDMPAWQRFTMMLKNYLMFDFGVSFTTGKPVITMIIERMPVSFSLGLWSFLIIYGISIPLGIKKAIKNGAKFDTTSTIIIIIGNCLPAFLVAVALIIFFAGGRYLQWFPLRGLVSDNFDTLSWWQQILDYLWHLILPVISMTIGGFASLTMLTKNSYLDELSKPYINLARAKGLSISQIMRHHVFQNAMLIVISGMPAALVGILFTESLLIEIIFSLNGLGLMGFDAILTRDYPVFFATLYCFTLLGLLLNIISDWVYTLIDPRINFEAAHA